MALSKEMEQELGLRLCKTDIGSLIHGFQDASEKAMLRELLENQFTIMRVLAEMNGMSSNPKHYKDLLE
jgi:hypothetical protein